MPMLNEKIASCIKVIWLINPRRARATRRTEKKNGAVLSELEKP